jgi:hypothetical protein
MILESASMEVEDICVGMLQEAAAGDEDLGGGGRDETARGGDARGLTGSLATRFGESRAASSTPVMASFCGVG